MEVQTEGEERESQPRDLVIDNVLSTQPELGPVIPDGGYGWIVFIVTLFFQVSLYLFRRWFLTYRTLIIIEPTANFSKTSI